MITREQAEALQTTLDGFRRSQTYPVGTMFILFFGPGESGAHDNIWVDELITEDTVRPICGYKQTPGRDLTDAPAHELGDYSTLVVPLGTPEHDLITAYVMWRAMRCDT